MSCSLSFGRLALAIEFKESLQIYSFEEQVISVISASQRNSSQAWSPGETFHQN